MFTIWFEKETELVDKVTGGGPASLLGITNPKRKIAAKDTTYCLAKAVRETRAYKAESKAARERFFTPQPHIRQTTMFDYSN